MKHLGCTQKIDTIKPSTLLWDYYNNNKVKNFGLSLSQSQSTTAHLAFHPLPTRRLRTTPNPPNLPRRSGPEPPGRAEGVAYLQGVRPGKWFAHPLSGVCRGLPGLAGHVERTCTPAPLQNNNAKQKDHSERPRHAGLMIRGTLLRKKLISGVLSAIGGYYAQNRPVPGRFSFDS